MLKSQFLLLLIAHARVTFCVIDSLHDAGNDVMILHSMIDKISMNTSEELKEINHLLSKNSKFEHKNVRNKMDEIHMKLKKIEESMDLKIIRNILETSSLDIMLYKCMDIFDIFSLNIVKSYEDFRHSIDQGSYHDNNLLQNFALREALILEINIAMIRKIITDAENLLPNHKNLVYAVAGNAIAQSLDRCDGLRINSNLLVHLFKIALIVEIKNQVMLASTSIHRYPLNEEWKRMNSMIKAQFKKYFEQYVRLFQLNFESIENMYLKACDPIDGNWTRGESFYELEGISQATIFRYHWPNCRRFSCNDLWKKNMDRCPPTYYDTRSVCEHEMAECAHLSSIKACALKNGPYKFKYVNSSELGFLGNNSECPKNNGYKINDGHGWDYVFGACACNCYGNKNKISLAIIKSDVEANKVITAVRFVKQNKILFIQPQHGTLTANGLINRFSQRWVSISNNVKTFEIHSIDRNNRAFFLDDVRLPPGYVLTGIKFNNVTRDKVSGFAIQIFGLPFDYRTGKLDTRGPAASTRASNDHLQQALVFNEISSLQTTLTNKPSPRGATYVQLKRSTLRSDFGQSTLPFFDAVPVRMNPPSPMSGIGIFHKGVEGYAGFISMKIYTLRYAKYFQDFTLIHMTNGRELFNICNCTVS